MRTFVAYERLARSFEVHGKINPMKKDDGGAAIQVHAMFKQLLPPRDKHHTVKDYDRVAANYLGRKTELPEEVIQCIDSHNGPEKWGEGKAPETDLEQLHHMADMIGSDRNGYFALYKPHPKLQEVVQKPLEEAEL